MTEQRNYSLDLLKILSMVMIVTSHVLFSSGTLNKTVVFSIEYFVTQTLSASAYCFTNCFALITGYYLCRKKFTFVRILKIYVSVLFYSFFLTAFLITIGTFNFSANNFIKIVFPISSIHYWYITAYIGLCFLSPFINIVINNLKIMEHAYLICVMSFLFVLIPGELIGFSDAYCVHRGYSWIWFVYMYVIASFIWKYPQQIKKINWFLVIWLSVFFTAGSRFIVAAITSEFFGKIIGSGFLYRYNSISVTLGTISIFLYFLNLEIKAAKWKNVINVVTPLLLGVYLIHMQIGIQEEIKLWLSSIFVYHGYRLYVSIVFSVLIIFSTCACVEQARLIFFEKMNIDKIIQNLGSALDRKLVMEITHNE